jgi:Rad3-related DNA helicase
MTAKTLDEIMRRVLNDADIFYVSYTIFDDAEWKNLGEEFQKGNLAEVIVRIDEKIDQIQYALNSERNRKKKETLEKAIKLAEALKSAVNNKPHILKQMFCSLGRFGLVKCNLPSSSTMEDFGKVIENHNRSTVEQYFLYKIDKERNKFRKRALKKTLEYLKELYAMKLDTLEIAFFIRKLDSLTQFMEVIKDE